MLSQERSYTGRVVWEIGRSASGHYVAASAADRFLRMDNFEGGFLDRLYSALGIGSYGQAVQYMKEKSDNTPVFISTDPTGSEFWESTVSGMELDGEKINDKQQSYTIEKKGNFYALRYGEQTVVCQHSREGFQELSSVLRRHDLTTNSLEYHMTDSEKEKFLAGYDMHDGILSRLRGQHHEYAF